MGEGARSRRGLRRLGCVDDLALPTGPARNAVGELRRAGSCFLGRELAEPGLGFGQRRHFRERGFKPFALAQQVRVEAVHDQRRGHVVDRPQAEAQRIGPDHQQGLREADHPLAPRALSQCRLASRGGHQIGVELPVRDDLLDR